MYIIALSFYITIRMYKMLFDNDNDLSFWAVFFVCQKSEGKTFETEKQGRSREQGPPRIGSASVRKKPISGCFGCRLLPYGKRRALRRRRGKGRKF